MQQTNRQTLLRTVQESERQVERLRRLLQAKRTEIQQHQEKLELASKVQKLADQARKEQPEKEERIRLLEEICKEVEMRSTAVNSKQTSTPEIREINQEIETVWNRNIAYAQQITQLNTEIKSSSHDIENAELEMREQKETFIKRSAIMYSQIQKMREEISKTRFNNLTTLMEKKDSYLMIDISLQKVATQLKLYQRLNSIFPVLAEFIEKPEIRDIKLKEAQKEIETVILSVPSHEPIPMTEQESAKQVVTKLLEEIRITENKIMASISEMAKVEDEQDELSNKINEAQQAFKALQDSLRRDEVTYNEIKAEKDRVLAADARNYDDAIAEIRKLKSERHRLSIENKEMKERIDKLRIIDNAGINRSRIRPPIDKIREQVENDLREVKKKMEVLREKDKTLSLNQLYSNM